MKAISHWRFQRVTAILLLPLLAWLLWQVTTFDEFSVAAIHAKLESPVVVVLLLLTMGISFYHGKLGIEVVVEDYISDEKVQHATILICSSLLALVWVLGTIAVFAV